MSVEVKDTHLNPDLQSNLFHISEGLVTKKPSESVRNLFDKKTYTKAAHNPDISKLHQDARKSS